MIIGEIDDKSCQDLMWLAACLTTRPPSKKSRTFASFLAFLSSITKLRALIFALFIVKAVHLSIDKYLLAHTYTLHAN